MADAYFILEGHVTTTGNSALINQAIHAVESACAKPDSDCHVTVPVFKVVGEPCFVTALHAGSHAAVDRVVDSLPPGIHITCTPTITYEEFSQNVLGVDKKIIPASKIDSYDWSGHHVYWVNVKANHTGKTMQEYIDMWNVQASSALKAKLEGSFQFQEYKIVSQREVHAFWKVDRPLDLDSGCFTGPMMVANGPQIHHTVKAVYTV